MGASAVLGDVRFRRLVAGALIALSGCSDSATGPRNALEFARARARWRASAPASYDFGFRQSCFCLQETLRPVVISVRDGQVAAAHYADDGTAVPAWLFSTFPSIDGMFERIGNALAQPRSTVAARYDGSWGFPVEVSLDYDLNTVDDEVSYWLSDFHPSS